MPIRHLKDNKVMRGIQFVTDEKGRKVAVQIDLKKIRHGVGGFLGRADFGIARKRGFRGKRSKRTL